MGRSPFSDESGLKKGPWTPEEDEKLINYINNNGHRSWRALPKLAGLNRCGKSCRLRWTNYLRPDIKRGKFSSEEEQTILNLHAMLGNKWSTIATHLPGRTDNEIKNYWNTHLKKKLIQLGFDPMTHQPRTNVFSSLPHLIALTNLKYLIENLNNNPSWLQNDQMTKIQNLQYILQQPPHDQQQMVSTFPISTINNNITSDLDTIKFLNSISSSRKEKQLILNHPFNYFLDDSLIQAMHDSSIPSSHLPALQQLTSTYPMYFENRDSNNNHQVCAFNNVSGENSPNTGSPLWISPSLSESPPPPVASNHVVEVEASFSQTDQSIVWTPELFMDGSLFFLKSHRF